MITRIGFFGSVSVKVKKKEKNEIIIILNNDNATVSEMYIEYARIIFVY